MGVTIRKNTIDIIIGLIILFRSNPNFNQSLLNGRKTDGMNIAKIPQTAARPIKTRPGEPEL